VDLLADTWDLKHVLKLMAEKRKDFLCDLFLDQTVFAGSGNIVKNEVLFNIRRHPLVRLGQINSSDWPDLALAVREYCWNFYEWKKKFELRKHWQVYRKSTCPLCGKKLTRKNLGKFSRRTFFCSKHQSLAVKRRLHVHPVLPLVGPSSEREAPLDH
jgi:endonuclease VIII